MKGAQILKESRETKQEHDRLRADLEEALTLLFCSRPYYRELGRHFQLIQDVDEVLRKHGKLPTEE